MEISWFGNSTFLLKTSTSKRILIDPFNMLKTFSTDIIADIATFSKPINKYYKPNTFSSSKIIYSDDTYKNNFVKISSYKTFGDSVSGFKRGENFIHTFELDGFKFCHLGYLDYILNNEILNSLKDLDFLFIPIGGHICLSGKSAYKLSKLINAKYLIPMCYKSSNSDFLFDNPLEFLSKCNHIFKNDSNTILTNNLPNTNSVILLK